MTRACQAADDGGEGPILLVGDEPYYAPFGFAAAPTVILPGPVDQRRVLVRSAAKRGQENGAALGGMVEGAGTKL